ncbi:MAG: MarR family transcriptional regulator [Solirubrobacteraceae bacterium]
MGLRASPGAPHRAAALVAREQRSGQYSGADLAKAQLLLTIRGHPDAAGPTIGELADHLVLRHHSTVGLVDRAVNDGLVQRNPDGASKRVGRVTFTPVGPPSSTRSPKLTWRRSRIWRRRPTRSGASSRTPPTATPLHPAARAAR